MSTPFTDAEKEALWHADGQSLATVALRGGVLREIDPSTQDFTENFIADTPVDAARRALFAVGVYCIDRKLASESNITRKWSRLPEDVRPPISEIEHILKLGHVFHRLCIRDLAVEKDGDEDAGVKAFYEVTKTGQMQILYPLLADHVFEELSTISFNGTVYVYQDGIYTADKGRIAALVKEVLEEIEYKGAFSVVRREVIEYLLAENPQDEYPFNLLEYHIPVKNGVVRIDPKTHEIDLIPHAPELRFTYRLNVVFDPDADCSFIIDTFNQWVETEDVRFLLQPLAVSFLQAWGQPQKQCYLFEGKRDGGKTSYCEFLYEVVGPGAFSQVDLYSITKDRFALADLEGKMMNIRDEMRPVNINSAEAIKNLTGGLKHRIERKHVDAHHVTLPAAHVFTCNKPPAIKDVDDDAFWSRWVYVLFPNQFLRDASFKKKLNTEVNKSAYLNLVLRVVTEVMRDPDALKRMSPDEVCERWTEAADATIKFVRTHFDTDALSSVGKDEVYSAYIRHCQENKIPIRPKPSFSADLNRMGIVGARPRDRGARLQVYVGIRWKTDSSLRGQGGQGELKLIAREEEIRSSTSTSVQVHNNLVDRPDHPDQGGDTHDTPSSQPASDMSHTTIEEWFESVGLPRDFDLREHQHHPGKSRKCSVRLCNRPAVWEGVGGSWPICDHHHKIIKRAIEEARS